MNSLTEVNAAWWTNVTTKNQGLLFNGQMRAQSGGNDDHWYIYYTNEWNTACRFRVYHAPEARGSRLIRFQDAVTITKQIRLSSGISSSWYNKMTFWSNDGWTNTYYYNPWSQPATGYYWAYMKKEWTAYTAELQNDSGVVIWSYTADIGINLPIVSIVRNKWFDSQNYSWIDWAELYK